MMRCDAGLGGDSHEFYDLLEYLADQVQYFPESHYRNKKGKLVPPFITKPSRWHCTKQGDWERAIACTDARTSVDISNSVGILVQMD